MKRWRGRCGDCTRCTVKAWSLGGPDPRDQPPQSWIGSPGLVAGLGATISKTIVGWVADRLGAEMAFLGLAAVAGMVTLLLAFALLETRPPDE